MAFLEDILPLKMITLKLKTVIELEYYGLHNIKLGAIELGIPESSQKHFTNAPSSFLLFAESHATAGVSLHREEAVRSIILRLPG